MGGEFIVSGFTGQKHRLVVVPSLDGPEAAVLGGFIYIVDTGDHQRNRSVADRALDQHDRRSTFK